MRWFGFGAAASGLALAVLLAGCIGAEQPEDDGSAPTAAVVPAHDRLEHDGLCDLLGGTAVAAAAEAYGYELIERDDASGWSCHQRVARVVDGEARESIQFTTRGYVFDDAAAAGAAHAAWSDPESPEYRLALAFPEAASITEPTASWDRGAVVSNLDPHGPEMRALMVSGRVVVEYWLRLTPMGGSVDECARTGDPDCAIPPETVLSWIHEDVLTGVAVVIREEYPDD